MGGVEVRVVLGTGHLQKVGGEGYQLAQVSNMPDHFVHGQNKKSLLILASLFYPIKTATIGIASKTIGATAILTLVHSDTCLSSSKIDWYFFILVPPII